MDPRRGLTGRKRHQKASTSDYGRRQSVHSGYSSEVQARVPDYPDDDAVSLFSQASVDTALHSRYSTPPTESDVEGPFPLPPPDRAPSSLASRHPANALIRLDNTMLSSIGMAITEEPDSETQEHDGTNGSPRIPKDMTRAEALLRRVRSKIDNAAEQKKAASQAEAQLSADLDEAKDKIASLEGEKRELSSNLNKATNRASALEGRETQLVAELNNAKGRIETLSASESRLKTELQSTTKEVGTLREAKGKLEVELEEEKTRAQRNEHVFKTAETKLKSDLERGKKDMEDLRESKMKVVAERDALRKELDAYRAMIEKRMLGIYKMLLESEEVLDAMGCKEMEGFEFPGEVR